MKICMINLFKISVAACLLVLSVIAPVANAADEREPLTLSFGLYSSSKPSMMVRKFRPMITVLEAKMSQRLGQPVKIRTQIAKDYHEGIQHLTSGKVDFARFGASSYVVAKQQNKNIRIIAIESTNRTKLVSGIIAVGLNSPIRELKDLKGKSFAFGNENSTTGRFMVQQFLLENGLSSKDLSHYEYLGRHDIVGTKVGSGDFDAGAMTEGTFRRLLANGEKIRELARFEVVSEPWIARANIDQRTYTALRNCLLEMKQAAAIKSLGINGFVRGSSKDYTGVSASMQRNDRFFLGDRRRIVANNNRRLIDNSLSQR